MNRLASLSCILLAPLLASPFMGCSTHAGTVFTIPGTSSSTTPANPTAAPMPTPTPVKISSPSIYVEDDASSSGPWILVIPAGASDGTSSAFVIGNETNPLGTVSLDLQGNIYALSYDPSTHQARAIVEYSPETPLGTALRSLPVGAGTKIPSVTGLYASATGEVFVTDGTSLSVFSATASGNDDPVRHISGLSAAGTITVDANDNVYVVNNSATPIVVYDRFANGNAAPVRALGGDSTQLDGAFIGGITTDTVGNLYVVCLCRDGFGVHEFGPSANGNVEPIRVIAGSLTGMYPYFASMGVAIDTQGYIYVDAIKPNATAQYSLPAIFKFAPAANGNTAPDSVVTINGWLDSETPQIAVR